MTLCSDRLRVERVQPWLGTFVKVGVCGLSPGESHQAIDEAFEVIAHVHSCMSFHAAESDVSRLNRAGSGQSVLVDPHTFAVLQRASELSARTSGLFDISIGAELSRWRLLPSQPGFSPDQNGCWEDLELLRGNRVLLKKRVCIDLGGIAKGFAVDRAIEVLGRYRAERVWVNAGGDIRVSGSGSERVLLDSEESADAVVVDLEEGSVASSRGATRAAISEDAARGWHIDGRTRLPAPTKRFVSVFADRCIHADALTKVVMVLGTDSEDILRSFNASALTWDHNTGWTLIAREAVAVP